MEKNIIIGTAGHIDHGKTTLIKALTGRETDRLAEEKNRGISIELGFTYFDLPSGRRAGIIDVPGHERFIKNMLAGVSGIDVVILVVAADEGIMPQTLEHLNILNLLDINNGIIALTKCDLVDEEWKELVKEDIKENIKNTFLENGKIIEVSSTKKIGIDILTKEIDTIAESIKDRDIKNIPRLPIDRVFTLTGFGTVVTGTLLQGTFNVGDEIEVFPKKLKSRIRSIQVHEENSQKALAGQRVAINLPGIKKSDIDRGDIVALPESMVDTMMLDVKLELLKDSPWIVENRTRLRLYLGTQEILCRAVLLDKEYITPGESGYVQLRLEEKTSAKVGDRFIIRFYSPMTTIGGGIILDGNPLKKKRFKEDIIEELKIKETGNKEKIIEESIKERSKRFPTTKELSTELITKEDEIIKTSKILENKNKILIFEVSNEKHYVHKDYYKYIRLKIKKFLQNYHNENPVKIGILREELRSKYFIHIKPKLGELLIDKLIEEDVIKQNNLYISLYDFEVELNKMQKKIKQVIENDVLSNKYNPPKINEVIEKLDYKKEDIIKIIESMIQREELILLDENLIFHKEAYEEALDKIKKYIYENEYISLAEFRDILNTSRKYAIALLEDFDRKKITKRIEDKRKLY
ncbi:selenocysteine-specific translation elongation factor [Anaeromonas gelatinilytica]|uniref:selenocysteine-specific translation elongation factor n=1 Tax=Anaeromonas gelatinilytica TaxID=2683194 RepID=UPI003315EA61